jgi:hypothetical protein
MIKKNLICIIEIFTIILLAGILTAYTSSNPQSTQYGSSLSTQSESFCQQGSDFLVQISPFDCSPAVVRSDLLEENNVPIYCQLSATKINPLIDVKSIESITFSGKYSPQVSGVAFYPAKAALGTSSSSNSASLSNIGYVVIMLKKQSNESAMPDFVVGNLTAKLKYNVDTAFGIGSGAYYLPEFLSDSEWQQNKYAYSFWNGKGYLQADNIEADNADISIYSTTEKISTVSLKKGETSKSVYLPGFECQAGLKLTLQDIQNPDTRARLRINSDVVEVSAGEKFLNNKCTVQSLNKKGLIQDVTFKCQEDSKTTTHSLTISPKVTLNIGGITKDYSLGDRLFTFNDKEVYLGYVGSKGNTKNSKDAYIFLYAVPSIQKVDKLSDSQLRAIGSTIGNLMNVKGPSSTFVGVTNDALVSLSAFLSLGANYIVKGEDFQALGVVDGKKNFFGQDVTVVGFAGAEDVELNADALEQYNNAKQDYSSILESFAEETYSGTTVYGEEAAYQQIVLAFDAGQKATASSLCDSFNKDYPNSIKDISAYCNSVDLSSSDVEGIYVVVNKQTEKISFDGVYEPSIEEYGAYINIENADGYSGQIIAQKNMKIPLSGTETFSLKGLDEDSATFDVSNIQGTLTDDIFKSGSAKINLDTSVTLGKNKYKITLTKINLKKVAKVSLKSNIDNTGTQANFSFKIGIEKRANLLAPSMVKGLIGNLSKDIKRWQDISDGLNSVNKVLKTSCIATGAALVVKNFILGTEGKGIARQSVMEGKGGWSSICAGKVAAQEYVSLDQCYTANSDKIDKDVSDFSTFINSQNDEIKNLESAASTTSALGEKVVDTNKFMSSGYIPEVKKNLEKANIASTISDPSGTGTSVDVDNLLQNVITSDGYNNHIYSVEQLREIELYSQISSDTSVSEELRNLAKQNLYSTLFNIQSNAKTYASAAEFASGLGVDPNKITFLATSEKSKSLPYEGLTDSNGNPIAYVQTSMGVYTVVLDGSAGTSTLPIKQEKGISQIKDSTGKIVTDSIVLATFKDISFKKYDSTTYKNTYKNAKLSYYETAPYAGMPAIVPFDKTNGWYASISETLPTGNNIASYQDNGKVSSFWVCNVGANGLEENKGGDDVCEMINTGTGQPYNQFPGLSESEATKLINRANQAIEQASKAYSSSSSGKVKILDDTFNIGAPAVDIPQFQCQDFMSPKDCLLLFNLCDPVICPSSRCDLGGTYPVKDVVQTGIVGSIALCLPNIQEGIVMPICLTGVQAGVDGLISVQKSYRDCLNSSLTTGQTVGICDEVYSIYLCDFFWKQAIPIAKMIVPALLTTISGQNVRGGGEYLSVSSAWGTSEKAINYLVNYYGSNAKSAFAARSSELVQDEVCKLYTSATVPTGGDFFDTLIQSDSPAQYTARFDEIPLTTATSPATSQYKVYFHVYAGKDSGAYYQVYLKGSADSTYYKDTSQSLAVDSGYVAVGSQVDKTKDIIATAGYKELCINVNGEEECGFKQVSTSFAINYATETYAASEASKTDITKTSDCISGSANIYSLLVNLNAQAAAESLVNPAIYNQGIIRVCATSDPGAGSDSYSGTENSRWKAVGYCDDENIKCWIDTESIKEVLRVTSLQNSTLSTVSSSYDEILANQYGYLTSEEFDSAVTNINGETDSSKKVTLIDAIIDKVFLNNEKAKLYLLRGNAYADLLKLLIKSSATTIPQETTTGTSGSNAGGTQTENTETTTPAEIPTLSELQQQVLNAAKSMEGTSSSRKIYSNCWDAAYKVYTNAEVSSSLVFSNVKGMKYSFLNTRTNNQIKTITMGTDQPNEYFTADGQINFLVYGDTCIATSSCSVDNTKKLDNLQPGDLISYVWDDSEGHNSIFIEWSNKATHVAKLFDWNGILRDGETSPQGVVCNSANYNPNWAKYSNKPYCNVFRYYTEDLDDDASPVYVVWKPYVKSQVGVAGQSVSQSSTTQHPPVITTATGTSSTSTTTGEKIYNHVKKYAEVNSNIDSINLVINSLKAAGITDQISNLDYENFASSLKEDSNFYEVNVSKTKTGDIVLLRKGCQTLYSTGIVGITPADKAYLFVTVFYNSGSKVIAQNITLPLEISTNVYPYKAYRYVGDLSTSDKAKITKVFPWTITNALNYISDNNLKGSYSENKGFMNELVFDGVLTEKECSTMQGGIFGIGQKDILWLKQLLLSKKGTSGEGH